MRVAGVELRDHPGLGDLVLDFRNAEGRAPKLIVVAGENGCGKTALLEAIFFALASTNFFNRGGSTTLPIGWPRVLVEPNPDAFEGTRNLSLMPSEITVEERADIELKWPGFNGLVIEIGAASPDNRFYHRFLWLMQGVAYRHPVNTEAIIGTDFGCFLSEANVSFIVPPIETVTALGSPSKRQHLPADVAYPLRGGQRLGTEIPQLLVDIQAADASELASWGRQNPGKVIPANLIDRRIRRFADAFALIVPDKRFKEVVVIDGEHRPMFTQYGFETSLAELSTGEKQIVFRGAFLLRSAEHLPGAVVLIDEPELSLHPRWQSGILDYYDKIVQETPNRESQVVLATHSPFVVHGSPAAKHIILRRDGTTGRVSVDQTATYPGVTSSEVAVAAFELSDFLVRRPGNRLAVVTEGKTDSQILTRAWAQLRPGREMPFDLLPADGAQRVQTLLGNEANKMGALPDAITGLGIEKFLGLFDFDEKGFGQWNGMIRHDHAEAEHLDPATCAYRKRKGVQVWAALLPLPSHRQGYAGFEAGLESKSRLTIELLFEDRFVRPFLEEEAVPGAPGITILVAPTTARAKGNFADVAETFPAEAFAPFEPILALIERILAA